MKPFLPLCAFLLFATPVQADLVVTFAGDYGATDNTKDVLKRINTISPDFHVALGDLSYGQMPEKDWCAMVTSAVKKPVLLLAGNHETNAEREGSRGDFDAFTACLPNNYPAPVVGEYGKEYYIDIPPTPLEVPPDQELPPPPLARLIMLSPDITFNDGRKFTYEKGGEHSNWLDSAIETARQENIRWIIVGMHKSCLDAETKTCEIGKDLANQLVEAKVDIVLTGHAHAYARTYQLTCVKPDTFDASCVNSKSGFVFKRGKGTFFVTTGTGGTALRAVNQNDAEAPYFAKLFGSNEGNYYGVTQLSISKKEVRQQFIEAKTGYILDEFTVRR